MGPPVPEDGVATQCSHVPHANSPTPLCDCPRRQVESVCVKVKGDRGMRVSWEERANTGQEVYVEFDWLATGGGEADFEADSYKQAKIYGGHTRVSRNLIRRTESLIHSVELYWPNQK